MGDEPDALDGALYAELHAISARVLGRAPRGPQTLRATELVHEAWMKLRRLHDGEYADREHFVATASRVMRQVLVDHVRTKRRVKHGGDAVRVTFTFQGGEDVQFDLLVLDDVLAALEAIDPRAAQVVTLRVFGGLTVPETAEALGVSPRTIDSAWRFARAFLREQLAG